MDAVLVLPVDHNNLGLDELGFGLLLDSAGLGEIAGPRTTVATGPARPRAGRPATARRVQSPLGPDAAEPLLPDDDDGAVDLLDDDDVVDLPDDDAVDFEEELVDSALTFDPDSVDRLYTVVCFISRRWCRLHSATVPVRHLPLQK